MCALCYIKTNNASNQWFHCMALGRFISPLTCSPSSWEGQSQPSLLHSLCCCTFLVIQSSLLPVLGDLTSPPSQHYLMPLHFYLMWTVVCWHLSCSLIFTVKHCDSSNRLLLGWRQNYLTKYSYSFVSLVFSGRRFILFSQLHFSRRILIQGSYDLRFSEFEFFPLAMHSFDFLKFTSVNAVLKIQATVLALLVIHILREKLSTISCTKRHKYQI